MLATILWPAIVATILPIGLRALLNKLPALAQRLAKITGAFPRQIESHCQRYQIGAGSRVPQCC
jgi:hypothetical protein